MRGRRGRGNGRKSDKSDVTCGESDAEKIKSVLESEM